VGHEGAEDRGVAGLKVERGGGEAVDHAVGQDVEVAVALGQAAGVVDRTAGGVLVDEALRNGPERSPSIAVLGSAR
jgi:hypothetical protein